MTGQGARTVASSPAQRERRRQLDEAGQVGLLRHCLTVGVELIGTVTLEPLQRAVDWVAERHPALRSTFPVGQDHHVVHDDLRIRVGRRFITGPEPDQRWEQAVDFAYQDRMRPFDLVAGPLLRANLLSVGPERHLLVLSFDQMVTDARSAVVVVDEIVECAHLLGSGKPLAVPGSDGYPDFRRDSVAWLTGPAGTAAVRDRRAALRGTTHALPWRRMPDEGDGDSLAHTTISLPDDVSDKLFESAKEIRVLPFAAAVAAFALMAAGAGGVDRYTVTSMFACRLTRAADDVVGWLANRVAVVIPQWTGTVEDVVRAAHGEVMAALDKQRVPLEQHGNTGHNLTASLLYLSEQLSGATQTDMRMGRAAARRLAVSFCPTGADVDLFLAEGVRQLTGEQPRLAVGGVSVRSRVGHAQLRDLVTSCAGALEVVASVPWRTCTAADALARVRDHVPAVRAS
ncbi:condensation domain-containing protein [Actinophytocola sp.]|uniref:condensation domain-containing protein n=1 Tax=Actinophytocola sp. TaxID=1872138 RepID=UPI00389A7924